MTRNPEATRYGQCEATSKTTGNRCGRAAIGEHGKCGYHGGKSPGAPTGPDNGNWKHGLFSRHLSDKDRAVMERIQDMATAAKLEATLNYELMKLNRAIEGMESEDRAAFMDVFEEVVAGAAAPDGQIDKSQLQSLAQMLGENDRAIREWMDLIRRTAKDLHKITDGETVKHEHGLDADELEGRADMAEDLF